MALGLWKNHARPPLNDGMKPQPPQPPTLHVIEPNAVYYREDVQRIFRLRPTSIRREIREKRLRVSRRCGRYRILGKWLLEWIEQGELRAAGKDGVDSSVSPQRKEVLDVR